jgi:hypothetical protein
MTDDIDLGDFQCPGPVPENPSRDYPTLPWWKPMRAASETHLAGHVRGRSRLPDGSIPLRPELSYQH